MKKFFTTLFIILIVLLSCEQTVIKTAEPKNILINTKAFQETSATEWEYKAIYLDNLVQFPNIVGETNTWKTLDISAETVPLTLSDGFWRIDVRGKLNNALIYEGKTNILVSEMNQKFDISFNTVDTQPMLGQYLEINVILSEGTNIDNYNWHRKLTKINKAKVIDQSDTDFVSLDLSDGSALVGPLTPGEWKVEIKGYDNTHEYGYLGEKTISIEERPINPEDKPEENPEIVLSIELKESNNEIIQHTHDFGGWEPNKTDTENNEKNLCKICGYIKFQNHPEYIETIVPPTCTSNGYTNHECPSCKDIYIDSYVPPKQHTIGNWHADNTNHWHICSECNQKVDEASHTVNEWVNKDTDNEKGTCTICYKEITREHSWIEDSTKYVAPTCIAKGSKHYYCSNCEATKIVEIGMIDHNFIDWAYNDNQHWHICSVCSAVNKEETKTNHTFGNPVITDATCTDDGSKVYTCTDCDYEKTEVIQALGHHPINKADNINHWKECDREGCNYVEGKEEHNYAFSYSYDEAKSMLTVTQTCETNWCKHIFEKDPVSSSGTVMITELGRQNDIGIQRVSTQNKWILTIENKDADTKKVEWRINGKSLSSITGIETDIKTTDELILSVNVPGDFFIECQEKDANGNIIATWFEHQLYLFVKENV